jgi:hypothetical protein
MCHITPELLQLLLEQNALLFKLERHFLLLAPLENGLPKMLKCLCLDGFD